VTAAAERVAVLAADLGRMRRHLRPEKDGYVDFLLGRVGLHVAMLDALLRPTAAEWVRAGLPVEDALAAVDADTARLRRALGEDAA
jgi:hypothetical protein